LENALAVRAQKTTVILIADAAVTLGELKLIVAVNQVQAERQKVNSTKHHRSTVLHSREENKRNNQSVVLCARISPANKG